MVTRSKALALTAATGLALPLVAFAGPADATTGDKFHVQKVITDQVVGPLQFSIHDGTVFVADAFTSQLTRAGHKHVIARGGDPNKGGDIAGVAAASKGRIAYTTSNGSHSNTRFKLMQHGKLKVSVNLAKFEAKHNPNHRISYGTSHPSSCVRDALKAAQLPVHYKGEKDSHPYAIAYFGNHRWAVADAGGNDILVVNDRTKSVSVLAVLPRVPMHITKKVQTAMHLPSCTVGVTYYTEGVPTDVEVGRHGNLYVTSLPGGSEDPSLPARGRVYKITPNGKVHKIGHGFAGATNLAVTPSGKIYVAELGAGRVSLLRHGKPQPVFTMAGAVGVEWYRGHLYVSAAPAVTGAHAPGEIVKLAAN